MRFDVAAGPVAGLVSTIAALLAAPTAAQQRAPDRFEITAIDVNGVTKLTAAEVERAVYPFTGPDRSGEDAEKARAAVQAVYAARGYEAVVVELPPQDNALFAQGIVTIKVSEAPVARVRVVDSRFHAPSQVLAQIPSVQAGEPLNLKALQSDLEAANRYPDRQITPSFKPGLVPGTIEVDLRVDSKRPLHGNLELNNDHSPSTSDLRLSGGVRYSNLWQKGHTISFGYAVAPQRRADSEVFSGSYMAPLLGTPWSLLLYGYKSNSNVAALGGTNVLGNGYQIGARAIYRLPSAGNFQSISFGPDFKDFSQDIFVAGVKVSQAPIRYVPLTVEYSFAKETENTSFDLTLGSTLGLRIVKRIDCVVVVEGRPCVNVDQFQSRSQDSRENFVRLNAGLNYSIATKGDFVGAVKLSGQFADSPLVTNEQFAVGGFTSVRGYLLSEAVGDEGANAAFEARLPSLGAAIGGPVDELRGFAFADVGYAHVRRPGLGQDSEFTLVSAGGGVRLRLFDLLTGEVVVAVPLTDGPVTDKGKVRATFVAKGEF